MPPAIALLPSPLLGPVAWEPVAEALRARGRPTVVAGLPSEVSTPDDVLDAFVSHLAAERDWVLVPHSNAGLFAPLLADARRVVATVFVDAALPPAEGAVGLAPQRFLELLARLAGDEGALPPWTQWWDEDDLDGVFPDAAWRRRVEATAPRLPLSYFESALRVPAGWAAKPCAYVAFGDTYADEVGRARHHGWPVDVLDGRHLHMLHDPDAVVSSIVHVLGQLEGERDARQT